MPLCNGAKRHHSQFLLHRPYRVVLTLNPSCDILRQFAVHLYAAEHMRGPLMPLCNHANRHIFTAAGPTKFGTKTSAFVMANSTGADADVAEEREILC